MDDFELHFESWLTIFIEFHRARLRSPPTPALESSFV